MNATFSPLLVFMYALATLLLLLAAGAIIISYKKANQDQKRHDALNTLAEQLCLGWDALHAYQVDVKAFHDSAVTKASMLDNKQAMLDRWHSDLKVRDESISALQSVVGVFNFPPAFLETIAHEKNVLGLQVTGVILRHPSNALNCTVVELHETWNIQHPRALPYPDAEKAPLSKFVEA
jgi:hypothetical protein